MTTEAGEMAGQIGRNEFCEDAIGTMCRFYQVNKLFFEQKLQEGYTEVAYGRGPMGWVEEKTAKYIVAFAAFTKKDSETVKTLEVRKEVGTFGSYSEGLRERKYLSKNYQRTINRFRLSLFTENLADFIQRYNWLQQ